MDRVAPLGPISTTHSPRQTGAAGMAIACGASFRRTFDLAPSRDAGRAGPIAAPGRCRPAPAAPADTSRADESAQCFAEGGPAGARTGPYQARRSPDADARVGC